MVDNVLMELKVYNANIVLKWHEFAFVCGCVRTCVYVSMCVGSWMVCVACWAIRSAHGHALALINQPPAALWGKPLWQRLGEDNSEIKFCVSSAAGRRQSK